MKQKILITSDLHLTDRYADEYRWSIFAKLREVAHERGATCIAILGDLTDAKGGHSAGIVNRMCKEIDRLAYEFQVFILKGNHDYTEEHIPFFGFLDRMPNVRFISSPELLSDVGGWNVLALPHAHSSGTKNFGVAGGDQGSLNTLTGTKVVGMVKSMEYDMIWIHNTVRGSIYSNGMVMNDHGVDLVPEEPRRHKGAYAQGVPIIAGDVHVPQEVGPVTYCGAPYPVCFGDSWLPRLLLWDDGEIVSIPIDSVQKHSIRIVGPSAVEGALEEVGGGDQVKVQVSLAREDMGKWLEIRSALFKEATARKATIEAISMRCLDETFLPDLENEHLPQLSSREAFEEYNRENMVSDSLVDAGVRIMES